MTRPAPTVTVPVEPTEAMLLAADAVDWSNEDERGSIINMWQCMLSAAPAAPQAAGVGERDAIAREVWIGFTGNPNVWDRAKSTANETVKYCWASADAIAALRAPSREPEGGARRFRHWARGTIYTEIGEARLQQSGQFGPVEGDAITVYRGEDGQLWARASSEFHDGRFEELPALATRSDDKPGGAVDDGAFKIATDLHNAYEQLIYGLPKYLDAENLTDEENMIREAWITLDVTAHRLAALATREEAPAEAGEIDLYDDKVQAGIAWTMRQWGETLGLKTWTGGDGSESVEGDVGAEIHTILVDAGLRDPETNEMASLRAQPQAREDAQPVGWVMRENRSLPWSFSVDAEDARLATADGFEVVALGPITRPATDALRVAVEALEPFATAFRGLSSRWEDHETHWQDATSPITVEELRRADQALAALQGYS